MSAGTLTDVHRMFLQVMMSRRVLSDREIRQTYSKLEPGGIIEVSRDRSIFENLLPVGDTNLTTFLAVINKKLEPLSMSVVKGKEEDTGHTYYALVHHKQDALFCISCIHGYR